LIWNQENLWF